MNEASASPTLTKHVALWAVVALLSVAPTQGAEAQIYNFHHYTNRDGLPQRQILAVHQGRESYLWFGTYGGLSRFNGTTIETYTTEDGLSSNVVQKIVEDGQGRFYLGTVGGGLCIMAAAKFRCLSTDDGLAAGDVHDLALTDEGTLWVATGGGLSRLRDGAFTSYTVRQGLPSNMVLALAEDDRGGLWIGTRAGLARLREGRVVEVHEEIFSDQAVQMLLPLPSGLLIGTGAGLYTLSGEGPVLLSVEGLQSNVSFNDAAQDSAGVVWIGTSDGLLRYEDGRFLRLTKANGLLEDLVNRVLVDREGNVWLGTEAGASKLVPGPFRAYSVQEGLPNSFARALAEDGRGRLWIGTRYGAAVKAGNRFREVVAGEELRDGRIYALAPTPGGGMLLGTGDGLIHWRGGFLRAHLREDGLPANFVASLLPARSGGIWVGTENGLALWQDGQVTAFPDEHPLSGIFVVSLAYDPQGRLWLGLYSGGVRIWDGRTVRTLDAARGLTDQAVWAMDVDSLGRMWVGTNGDGAFYVDGTEIGRVTTHQGLANDFVWQVLADSRGSIWLYTNRGLDRLRGGGLTHYDIGDGLIDLEGSAAATLEDSEGHLWFGTSSGALTYHPAEERINLVPPPVTIEEVKLGNVELAPGAEVAFHSELLRLRYAALSFRDESAVRYRYRLLKEGRKAEPWSEPVSDEAVTFAGLGPGDYTFEVVGINDAGIASHAPATFPFTVPPAVWQTWWFWVVGAGVLAGLAAAVPFLRARHLEAERARLQRRVADHTGELEEANTRLRSEIRERERFERALKVSEARLRDIVENSTNVFYSHTPDHQITYISPQVEDLLGVSPKEARMRWTEFATDNPVNVAGFEVTESAIRTGKRQPPYELELQNTDGESVWVRVTEAPVVRDGKTVAVVGSLTNVTAARRAEQERTRLEEQLHQAQKLEAVARLAGGVAHDFNNILTSILGHTELVAVELGEQHPLNPELREVVKACRRAASLVEQLLAYGRKQVVKPAHLDLNQVVQDGTKMLRRVLGEDVRLVTKLSHDAPGALVDRGQIDQILMNLAVNARDAMPQGGELTIATAIESLGAPPDGSEEIDFLPGEYAVLRVTDTGSGMDPETTHRIFEPFFTTKEMGKGTGLGLATVYGIVKQNDGYIWVDTEPEAGSTFAVYLPHQPGGYPEGRDGGPPSRSDGPEGPVGTILVVEDEEAVRRLVSRILKKEGFTVHEASDGIQALEIARTLESPVDLLITDMIMPGMTGMEVADAIRAGYKETRLLFISGYTDDILGKRGILTPGVELLQKPFDPGSLLARVRALMAG